MQSQTRLFYLTFLIPTMIMDIKAFQLVFYKKLFSLYLKILKELIGNLRTEVLNNRILKSRVYDTIIRRKLKNIISMHYVIVQMIECFNSSMGLSQLGILLAIKFYL